ncbi:hypothetical protein F4553_006457 [Allocatelliglobosispora scoriae]|uniref:Uncharacterized protein n=1 Tax=Allocatelliglobosispora scoriae TaxID=643052 RepID=A0A841C1K1_9ACTN|nr:hypothetical protein [Allocatelliglobosispora scoriae]MBB5873023.1 hypothetical protein [Allocatelliglobosispora scoriae]
MKWIRGLLVVAGVWMVVHAVRGVYAGLGGQDLFHYVRYLLGAWLLNDLVLVPIVIGLGFVATRWLPPWAKPYAQGALLCALSVVIVAYPLLTGHGKASDNPSALPRNYWVGLLVTLAAIGAVATGLALRANSSRVGAKKAEPPRSLEDS